MVHLRVGGHLAVYRPRRQTRLPGKGHHAMAGPSLVEGTASPLPKVGARHPHQYNATVDVERSPNLTTSVQEKGPEERRKARARGATFRTPTSSQSRGECAPEAGDSPPGEPGDSAEPPGTGAANQGQPTADSDKPMPQMVFHFRFFTYIPLSSPLPALSLRYIYISVVSWTAAQSATTVPRLRSAWE